MTTRPKGITLLKEVTAANLASAGHAISTVDKYRGKLALDATSNRLLFASGSNPTSPWYVCDGSATITPV